MKKITFLAIMFLSIFVNAQAPTVVIDVNLTNFEPFDVSKKFSKSSFWKGKYYYRGKGTSNTTLKLCATDGTVAGTTLIKEFNNPGYLYDIIAVKDFLYFVIDNTTNTAISTKELWKTDGTEAGTVLIKTFITNVSINNSVILIGDREVDENYSINENEIYFAGVSDAEGLELWRTNGTETSTVLVKDVWTGTSASAPSGFTRIGSTVYFAIYANTFPYTQLWKTDGTAAGTVGIGTNLRVYNQQLVPFNGKMYFYGFDSTNGLEPWVSDGTSAGTTMLLNTSPQTQLYSTGPFRVLKSKNYLVFPQENYAQNSTTNHFWKSDGTAAGTVRMTPTNGLPIFFNAIGFKNYTIDNDNFYAYATGKTLYKFNLQNNTNQSVLLPNSLEGIGNWLKIYNSELWLTYRNSTNGIELWKTDFVTAGMFADINVGSAASTPFGFYLNNNNFYFFANNGTGNKLYSLNRDVVFNGSVNDNWDLAGNWDSNSIPVITDNVIIPTNKNVVIDNTAFAKNIMINSPVNLAVGDLSVTGNIVLSSKATLNNNNLNLKGSNSLVTGNTSSYIVTNGTGKVSVENVDTARGNITLPIGTATNYNPITLSNLGTADTFSARVETGVASNYTGETQGTVIAEKGVNATWYINEGTNGGSNANVQLQWNESQELPNFDRPTTKMGHYNGTVWESLTGTLAGASPYTYVVNGVTSFSPFAVLNEVFLGTSQFEVGVFKLYPNPSNGDFTLQTTLEMIGAKAEVYNVMGQKIKSFELSGIETKQNLMNQGFYIVVIEKDGKKVTQKITIK